MTGKILKTGRFHYLHNLQYLYWKRGGGVFALSLGFSETNAFPPR
jgi:hypothetical protein